MPVTYDPEATILKIDGTVLGGWDSFEVSTAEERWFLESSTDGLTSHRKNPHRGGRATLTMSEESWEQQLLPIFRGKVDQEFSFSAVDNSGTKDSAVGESCRIVRQPNMRRGKEKVTYDVEINIGILHFKSHGEQPGLA